MLLACLAVNSGGWCWLAQIIVKVAAMWVNVCGWAAAVCVVASRLLYKGPEREMERTGTERRERINECRHSGRAGERWRALFPPPPTPPPSLSFFSECREVTSSSVIWRECRATLAPPFWPRCRQGCWFIFFLSVAILFSPSLINVWFVGRRSTRGGKERMRFFTVPSDPPHVSIRLLENRCDSGLPPSGCHLCSFLIGWLTSYLTVLEHWIPVEHLYAVHKK